MKTILLLFSALFKWLGSLLSLPKRCPRCAKYQTEKSPNRLPTGYFCRLCGLFFALILAVSPAFASSVTLLGGWEHTPNSNYSDGVEVDGRFETPLYRNLNAGIEASYHGPMTHTGYGDLSGESVLGELLYYPSSTWKLKPYVFGGAGWSWWNFDRNEDMASKDIVIKVGDAFAQKYGLGASYDLGNNWSVVIEWSYFVAHVPKDSHYRATGTFANVAGGSTVGEEETNLSIGIRRAF